MRILLIAVCLLWFQACYAGVIQDTLWINHDTISIGDTASGGSPLFHFCAFNDSANFNVENVVLELALDDTLDLAIINNDTVSHSFTIDGIIETGNMLLPGDTASFSIHLSQAGTYRYYSNSSQGQLLGGSGILLVGFTSFSRFYWNFFDCEDTVSQDLATGANPVIPNDYRPELFTINGHHYPVTLTDSTALVTGNVGDTIIISMLNSGPMVHSMHFHGYHVELLQVSINSHMQGWIKDSFAVLSGEAITARLVPDQPGMYPVHDHNLIAVTNAGFYPGGMITLLNIDP